MTVNQDMPPRPAARPWACALCAGERRRRLFLKDGYAIVRCEACGHVATEADLSRERLVRLYDTEFFSGGSYADYEADRPILQKNFARFVKVLAPYQPGGRLLDIGCAYGFFLDIARHQWDVEGIDVVEAPTTFARERLGLNVICGDFLRVPFTAASMDVVTMWDTIEHVQDPSAYLAKAARMLKPGGVLALTTGDVGSLMARLQGKRWRLYDPPFHLHYFSQPLLRRLLERAGLRVIQVSYVGFSRSLNMVLHRLLVYRKTSLLLRGLYAMAERAGVTALEMYLNVYDIMLVIARKDASQSA